MCVSGNIDNYYYDGEFGGTENTRYQTKTIRCHFDGPNAFVEKGDTSRCPGALGRQ